MLAGLAAFASFFTLAFGYALESHDPHLLYCPIKSFKDLQNLRAIEVSGAAIDIFEERIPANKPTFIHVLADGLTSTALMSRNGCFEDKAQSVVQHLLSPNVKPDDPATQCHRLGDNFHNNYRSYRDILAQLDFYERTYPSLVQKKISIGTSHEKRSLVVLHISAAPLGTKPLIWIQAGQHAREWIAPAATMYFIDSILKGYSKGDKGIEALLSNFEFAILPLVNPDGYEFSRTHNRMHRKNRRLPYGVDLNRNWDIKWGEIGSSKNPRTDSYNGPSPASEPEVKAVQDYVVTLPNRVLGFDIHSFGQLVLRNYGWTRSPSPIESVTAPMTADMVANIKGVDGHIYKAMISAGLYPCTGGADDWLFMKAGIPGFVLELRDSGRQGFIIDSDNIRPNGLELLAAIQTAVKYVKPLSRQMTFPNPNIVQAL